MGDCDYLGLPQSARDTPCHSAHAVNRFVQSCSRLLSPLKIPVNLTKLMVNQAFATRLPETAPYGRFNLLESCLSKLSRPYSRVC
ncbi:hypothetical protein ACU6T2_09780 [Avibacterium paragallinarum]